MAKHWIVVSLLSAGGTPHTDVITTAGDTRPSGQELRSIIQEKRGPVARLWDIGPMESLEAAESSAKQLGDLTNYVQVATEQAAMFR